MGRQGREEKRQLGQKTRNSLGEDTAGTQRLTKERRTRERLVPDDDKVAGDSLLIGSVGL